MKLRGTLQSIQLDWQTRRPQVTLDVSGNPKEIEKLKGIDLDIDLKKHRNKRSLDANAFLWACLGDLASALRTDNWSMYLYMLQRYGKYTYIRCRPEAVGELQRVWRETRVIGNTTDEQGNDMVEVICFFGSSTYNTEEFSRLIDGVISEMKEIGLNPPPDEQTRAILQEMEKRDQAKRSKEAGSRSQE